MIEKHILLKIVAIRPKDKPWMNGEVRSAIRKRNRRLRIHNDRPNEYSWENYRRQRNLTTKLIRSAKQCYYDKVHRDLSNPLINAKKWWSISNNFCGKKNSSRIPTLLENNILINNPKEKASIFNSYFLTLVRNVDISKACGFDGIGNRIIKSCSDGIYSFFTKFNLSFALGQYPTVWKMANVVPIFKKGDPQLKVNYRSVSLLPCLSKICESFLLDFIIFC